MILKTPKNRIAIDSERAIYIFKNKEDQNKIDVFLIDEDHHMGGSSKFIGTGDDLSDVKKYLIDNLEIYPGLTYESLHQLEL